MHEPSNQIRKGPEWTFETPFKFLGSSNKFVPQIQGTVRTLFIIGVATLLSLHIQGKISLIPSKFFFDQS